MYLLCSVNYEIKHVSFFYLTHPRTNHENCTVLPALWLAEGTELLNRMKLLKSSLDGYSKYAEKDCIFPLIYIQLNMRIVHVAYLHGRFQLFRESPCF